MKRLSPATNPMRRPGRLERLESELNATTLAKSLPATSSAPTGGSFQ